MTTTKQGNSRRGTPTRRLFVILGLTLFHCGAIGRALADDWGAYQIAPVSAPGMLLEAVGSATADGAPVSLGKAAGAANQKWYITPTDGEFVSIRAGHGKDLVLAAASGGKATGTAIVIEADKGKPWQQWSIKKNENGTYGLLPRHAPDKGIDDLGGKVTEGTKIDLWAYVPLNGHLQWLIKPLAGASAPPAGGAPEAGAAAYVPPAIKPDEIKPGEIKTLTYAQSKIFPGTTRGVTVFIPAQYDGSKPACVYVRTDGYNAREKQLLETLIATKEMPVTIGVFVRPGDLPAAVKGTLGRRNRCFEYDGVGDANVRFYDEELLPFVAKEFNLKLSTSGNDRCIAGGSSGGIAAFNCAWERPDLFSRVYAASGSFVAFRGGHEFPTLVRKFEAKPIRSFLTTATHDMENAAGDWFLLDQEMDKALKFSGYDYVFRIVEGRHVAGYYENYMEGMSYIWKGWPQPVQAGPSAPRVQDVILPNEPWKLVAGGRKMAEGPACGANGEVYFVEPSENKAFRIDPDGKVSPFLSDAGQANALSVGPQGQVYAVSAATGKVTSYDAAGKASPMIDGVRGNYILATPTGGLYITAAGETPGEPGQVWFVQEGKKTLVDSGVKFPTGLAYRPDQWLLSVADGGSKWAYSYQMNADGTLTNKERYFWLHVADWDDDAGAQSVCYAKEGQMFVATRSGIQVCADDGPTQVILPLPDRHRVIGVCLGGRDFDTLYAFTGDNIWARKVKTHAMNAATPWTAVKGTKL